VPRPPNAVIFDLDGTLFDHRRSASAAVRAWLPDLGAVADEALLTEWFALEDRHFVTWETGGIDFVEQRRRRLSDFLPLIAIEPGGPEELDGLFHHYLAHYQQAWTGFEDTQAAVAAVERAGLPAAILTNGRVEMQKAKVEAIGLTGRLGEVFTAEGLGTAKPEAASYLAVCASLGLPPAEVLHIGDRYDLDVVAARAAGLSAVHLDRTGAGPHDEPHRLTSLTQLEKYLDSVG
jgi:putative hydrolase of the HAD superfamily